jgi:hypothetical protein
MSNEDLNLNYLNDIKRLFRYYKSLGDKSICQLSDEQLLRSLSSESNSIAIIIKHLHGNMMSRWTDFKNSDGEKSWRNRDQEFEEPPHTREGLIELWNEGWACLFQALNELESDDLLATIYIRNEGHSILEAVNRQLAHYSYHVGQLVLLAKFYVGSSWDSLSIPKNQSKEFNSKKFKTTKTQKHFTEK